MRAFAFHQKFALRRERLALMIQCIAEGGATSKDAVATYMGVNPYMVEGFRGWLCKTGLGHASKNTYHLSDLGRVIATHDPRLERNETQWLLHYALANTADERAEVWYRFTNEFASIGMQFTSPILKAYVTQAVPELPNNANAIASDVNEVLKSSPRATYATTLLSYIASDVNEMLKSYTRPYALGGLGFVQKISKNEYKITGAAVPPPLIVGYILFDSWARHYPNSDTLRVSQVCNEPELPGRVLFASREQIVQSLRDLQARGLVTIADTQHEPVTRRFHAAPIQLLMDYYATL